MVFKVKNTTILRDFSLFSILCPEKCRGCGDRGEILCERCKKYIFRHYKNHCPVCKQESLGGVCLDCKRGKKTRDERKIEEKERKKGEEVYKIFSGLFSAGFRDEILGELVEEYKYYAVRGIAEDLGEIFRETVLGEIKRSLGEEIYLVPLPTSRKHIRERGFDHTELILRKAARGERETKILRLLLRAKDTTQVGASEKKRLAQAKEAYILNPRYFKGEQRGEILERPVVLFDDIWTTGASMTEAAKMLQKAGFSRIYGAVLGVNRKGRKPEIRRGEL